MVVRAGPEQSHPGILLRGQVSFSSMPMVEKIGMGGREMCSPESPLAHDRASPRATKWLPCFAHALS